MKRNRIALLAAGLSASLAAAVIGLGASANGATTGHQSPAPSVHATISGW